MAEHPNLAAALAAFQSELPHVGKANLAVVKSDKGSYKYTYADLSDVSAAVLPVLARHGLSFSAKPTLLDGKFVLEYTLRHAGGEFDTGFYPLSAQGTPQQQGSAITYARRYALSAVTGVVPDEDDDGQAASQQSPARQPEPAAPAASRAGAGDPVLARGAVRHACEENGWDLARVADLFAQQHDGLALRDCADALVIAKFRSSLFKMPQAELMPPAAVNGAPA